MTRLELHSKAVALAVSAAEFADIAKQFDTVIGDAIHADRAVSVAREAKVLADDIERVRIGYEAHWIPVGAFISRRSLFSGRCPKCDGRAVVWTRFRDAGRACLSFSCQESEMTQLDGLPGDVEKVNALLQSVGVQP